MCLFCSSSKEMLPIKSTRFWYEAACHFGSIQRISYVWYLHAINAGASVHFQKWAITHLAAGNNRFINGSFSESITSFGL